MAGKIRVLLIEDDPMVQEVNKQFIEKVDGFEVIDKASNGEEGLRKINELSPDLVVLDVYMPNKDGKETMHQIRKDKTDVDVLIITAANDQQTIRGMLQSGVVDYIIKPFKFDRIQQALENFKDYYYRLKSDESLSQSQVDQMLGLSNEAALSVKLSETQLPKGLNEITLKQIVGYLVDQKDPKSAEEVAEGVGLARVTARRYLEYLHMVGQIKLDVQYGGLGRPVNKYVMKKI
jgi:two-component system, CitB family, response regulator DctR